MNPSNASSLPMYTYTRHTLCLIYFLKYTYFSILVKWVVNWLVYPTVLKGRDLILSSWNAAPLQPTIAQLSQMLQSTRISCSLRGGIWPYCVYWLWRLIGRDLGFLLSPALIQKWLIFVYAISVTRTEFSAQNQYFNLM